MNEPAYSFLIGALRRDYVFWIVVVALLATVSYVSFWLSRRRRAMWKSFASENGLTYHGRGSGPRVSGTVGGRSFSLELTREGSDRGLLGIEVIRLRLGLKTGLDVDFDVTNEGILATALRESAGDDEIVHIGTEAFDQRTTLHTSHPDEVEAYLTNVRRAAILGLIASCETCDVHVTNTEIWIRERSMPKSVESLNYRLRAMQAAAEELEQ